MSIKVFSEGDPEFERIYRAIQEERVKSEAGQSSTYEYWNKYTCENCRITADRMNKCSAALASAQVLLLFSHKKVSWLFIELGYWGTRKRK